MSFIPMLEWWQWLILGAVPPAIVLLYFLKLKRRPLEVPSTFLWRRSIEDLRVNSIWQRLRQNLLLFLQLLLVLLAALALLRPGWRGSKLLDQRLIFLIDNSASMSSTDVRPTRLEVAKRHVGELIDQMDSGAVAMLISFADGARVEQPFTDNRRLLRRRLDAIGPTNRSTTLGEALRVAAGLANPGRVIEVENMPVSEGLPATLYLLSDGKFPDISGFSLGNLKPIFVPIGEPGCANLGITAFSVRRSEAHTDRLQAFARLENFGSQDVQADVELYLGDSLADAAAVPIKANEAVGKTFDLQEIHEGVLKLRLRSGGDLQLDDEAWAVVHPPRRGKVLLVTPGDEALRLALETPHAAELADVTVQPPDFLESKEYRQQATAGYYQLVIFDRAVPKEMPRANTLFIGRLPPGGGWSAAAEVPAPQVIDVDNAHPLMQLIELGNVKFASGLPLKPPPGSTTLIETSAGPLLAIGPREGFEDAVLGAELITSNDQGERFANTDWPLRLSFPVFVLNVLEYLGFSGDPGEAGSLAPAQSVALHSSGPAERLLLRTPSGKQVELERGRLSTFNFGGTDELGVYEVEQDKKITQRFAVNLLDNLESDIRPRPGNAIKIGYVEVHGQADHAVARRETWRSLLLVALAVLLLEWYIYNRRVYL